VVEELPLEQAARKPTRDLLQSSDQPALYSC
jgi:hypothetical protein